MKKRHYYRSNILSLNRNQKQVFYLVAELIRLIVSIIVFICKGLWEINIYIGKRITNHYEYGKMGKTLDDVMEMVEKISPRQFEIFAGELFKSTGEYSVVEVTKKTCDGGKDLVLTKVIDGYKEITFVEAKHWKKDNNFQIGREICQKLLGSCQMYNADKAIIFTTGLYHKNAYETARLVGNLTLMDNIDIKKMILELNEVQLNRIIMRVLNAS